MSSSPTEETPLVPDGQWVSPQAKKNRRTVLIVASILGSLLVLLALAFGLYFGGGSSPDKVAQSQGDSGTVETDNPNVEQVDNAGTGPDKNDVQPVPVDENSKDVPTSGNDSAETGELPTPVDPDAPASPPAIEMSVPEIDIPKPELPKVGGAEATDGTPKASVGSESSAENSTAAPKEEDEDSVLASILSSSGSSILAVKDAASLARIRTAPGRPKYFIEQRIRPRLNVEKQKGLDLPGAIYEGISLQRALHDLSDISGVSLSVEAPLFLATSLEINPTLDLKIENQNVTEVVSRIADSVGAEALSTPSGFALVPLSNDNPMIERIDTSSVDEVTRMEIELMLRKLVYPESWAPSDDPDVEGNKIRFVGKIMEVSAPPAVVADCKELVEAWFSLKATGEADAANHEVFRPFADLQGGKFAQPFESFNTFRNSIGTLLEDFETRYGLTVICDWNRLRQQGWSVQAMAPSRMDDATVGEALSEIAHSLNASVFSLDESSVWLTTFDTATSYFYIKVYPVGKIAQGRLTGEQTIGLINKAIGRELRLKGVVLHMIPGDQYLAVRAPQFLHRQIDAVLRSLEKPVKAETP